MIMACRHHSARMMTRVPPGVGSLSASALAVARAAGALAAAAAAASVAAAGLGPPSGAAVVAAASPASVGECRAAARPVRRPRLSRHVRALSRVTDQYHDGH